MLLFLGFLFGRLSSDKAPKGKNASDESQQLGSLGQSAASLGASQIGAEQAHFQGAAADEMRDGMAQFLNMVESVQNRQPHFRRGSQFETIIAAKENASRALQGDTSRMHVTHLEGRHTDPADMETRIGGKVISQAQAKFSQQSPDKIAEMVTDPKYNGMERYIPSNKVEAVKEELLAKHQKYLYSDPARAADYLDAANNLKNHNTTTTEVWFADRNSKLYSALQETKYVGQEMAVTGAQAATAGFVMGGVMSGIKNSVQLYQGKVSTDEALTNIAKDSGKATLRSGTAGAGGALIRNLTAKAGVAVKSNVAVSVANSFIDIGGTILDYSQGKISSKQAIQNMGQSGTSTISSIYAGAAAGAVFGPAGAIVGSVAGYMVASNVYQSCIVILNKADLAEEEAARVIALCHEAIGQMRLEREEFERTAKEHLNLKQAQFNAVFDQIDSGLDNNNQLETITALADFAELLGKELKLQDFNEFDQHMKNNNSLTL